MEKNEKGRGGLRAATVAGVAGLLVLLGAGNAFAVVDPATEAAITGGFGDLTGLVTGTLALALFGIVIAVLGIVMGVKWLRKGATT